MTNDELDRVLDEGLASYLSREPRPGLENRVLSRVRAEGARRRIPRWVFAIPALAGLVFLVMVFRPVAPPAPKLVVRTEIRNVVPDVPVVKPRKIRKSPRRALPKRDAFPTPTPLTAEERALLAFIKRSPEQARELFSPPPQQSDESIRIDEIRIDPLEMDEPK